MPLHQQSGLPEQTPASDKQQGLGDPPVTQLGHPQQTHPRVHSRHLHCPTGSRPSRADSTADPGCWCAPSASSESAAGALSFDSNSMTSPGAQGKQAYRHVMPQPRSTGHAREG